MSNSDRRTRLDKLDQEIPQLRLRLKQLERERSEIFSSLTFPVLTLPVEVTSEIFIHCLPTTPSAPRSSDAPLLLARVCRPWRNIALFTPRLWSTFSFPVNTPESQQARDYFINGWLSRSSNHGLFIRLYAMYEPGEDDEAEAPARARPGSIKTCLELFTKHSFRWRSVELCLKLSVLQNLPQATFPQLEHLTIGCWAQDDRDFRSSYLDFSAAPRLRSVKMLLDSVGDVDMRLVSLPWTQLTSFTGKEFCVNECFFVLTQSPALVDCTFSLCGDVNPNIPILSFLSMKSLKSLSVTTTSLASHSLAGLLAGLTVPGLETLSVHSDPGVPPAASFVVQLLTRSGCTLRHFTYSKIANGTHAEFLDCIRHMPGLSTLTLPYSPPYTQIFERLHEDLELVPHLEKLELAVYNFEPTFPSTAVIAMLRARSRPERPKPLRYFEIHATSHYFWDRRSKKDIIDACASRFEDLIRQGMQIRIRDNRRIWM